MTLLKNDNPKTPEFRAFLFQPTLTSFWFSTIFMLCIMLTGLYGFYQFKIIEGQNGANMQDVKL